MSCRTTDGSSAEVTLACIEHGMEQGQVQSVLHASIHEAATDGLRAGVENYRAHLRARAAQVASGRIDVPPRQRASLEQRLLNGQSDTQVPADEHRRAAIMGLDGRIALAKRHLAGYLDDAAARYGNSTEEVQERYETYRAAATKNRSLKAPQAFVDGLRDGAFTWGAPRDRVTAYALHRIAADLGYRAGHGGAQQCPDCGEFMGAGHACERADAGSAATAVAAPEPTQPASDLHASVAAYLDRFDAAGEDDDGYDDDYYDRWPDEDDRNGDDSVSDRWQPNTTWDVVGGSKEEFTPTENQPFPEAGVGFDAQVAWSGPVLTPVQAAANPEVREAAESVEGILTGDLVPVTQVAPGAGIPSAVVVGVPAAGINPDGLRWTASGTRTAGQVAAAQAQARVYPPLPLAHRQEVLGSLNNLQQDLAEHVTAMEHDLARRLDGEGLRSFRDDVTGLTASPVGGVDYRGWNHAEAQAAIADQIAADAGATPEQARAIVTEYAKYASVGRYRTRALRALGLRASTFAEGTPTQRAMELAYDAEPVLPQMRTEGLPNRLAAGVPALHQHVSAIGRARHINQTSSLPEAVRSYAAAKQMQVRLNGAIAHLEDQVVADMQAANQRQVSFVAVTGRVYTPGRSRKWHRLEEANRAVVAAVSTRVPGVSAAQTEAVVAKFRDVAPVDSFRVRSLPQIGLDAENYSAMRTPRTRIEWTDTPSTRAS